MTQSPTLSGKAIMALKAKHTLVVVKTTIEVSHLQKHKTFFLEKKSSHPFKSTAEGGFEPWSPALVLIFTP